MKRAFSFERVVSDWVLPVGSGVMLLAAFPPFASGQVALVALLPLLFAATGTNPGRAFRRGYVAGLVFFGGTIWWIAHVTLPGTVLLVAFLALYIGGVSAWVSWVANRIGYGEHAAGYDSVWRNLLLSVAATAGWVAVEWVRSWFLMGGFSWNQLGVSQWRNPVMIQVADMTGVYGVSAMVVFVNCGFFFTFNRVMRFARRQGTLRRLSWEFYAAMIVLCGVVVYGAPRALREPMPGDESADRKLSIAMVQANIPQSLKFEPGMAETIVERHRELTEAAMLAGPELMMWPETATVGPLRFNEEAYRLVTNLAARARAPMLVGTFDVDYAGDEARYYNAAALAHPDGVVTNVYRKIHLVPFGEYVPWRKVLPFMTWFTPVDESLERGRELTRFVLERVDAGPVRFSVVICFEDTVATLYRRFVRQDVDFMVNLTNDAWFKESSAAEMHLANAVFRAVETRCPMVRCTNNGVTCVVSEAGRVVKRLDPFTVGFMLHELRLRSDRVETFYVRHGDMFAHACVLVTALFVAGLGVGWKSGPRLGISSVGASSEK